MNRQSIFFTVSVSFIISVVVLVASFFVFINSNYQVKETNLYYKYLDFTKKVMKKIKSDKFEDSYYKVILDKNEIDEILSNPKVVIHKNSKKKNSIFKVLKFKNHHFVYLKKGSKTILIKDKVKIRENSHTYIILISSILLIILILMYLITLRKLMPLKIFKEKVQDLGEEKFNFECCNLNGKDEIALLAKEFKNSASKLQKKKKERKNLIEDTILAFEKLEIKDDKIKKLQAKLKSLKDTY